MERLLPRFLQQSAARSGAKLTLSDTATIPCDVAQRKFDKPSNDALRD
jgi:hypothetical protein